MRGSILLGALVMLGCSSTVIDTSQFQAPCTQDTDCVAVVNGDICSPCACPHPGISASQLAKYQQDVNGLKGGCKAGTPVCAPCIAMDALCLDSACTVRPE